MFITTTGEINKDDARGVILQSIDAVGEREAFKGIIRSAMKAYDRRYPKLSIDELTSMAYELTTNVYNAAGIELP